MMGMVALVDVGGSFKCSGCCLAGTLAVVMVKEVVIMMVEGVDGQQGQMVVG